MRHAQDPTKFIVLNIVLPVLLTAYFFYKAIWGISDASVARNEIDIMVGFLSFFLMVLIAPFVLIVDMYSIASGWRPELGSNGWQLKFFSKVLYFVLLVIFLLQLIF
jgi:hypothetical protein